MNLQSSIRCAVIAFACLTSASTQALESVRVGKSFGGAWTFTVLDVGIETGIFERAGLRVQVTAYAGDARMQQALTADTIDVGLGSGPGMGFMARGVPAKAIAAFATAPRNIGLLVLPGARYTGIRDMRGKRLGVTTVGSLTEWLVKQAALAEGWGSGALVPVPLGGPEANLAALKSGQVDGIVQAIESCYTLEERNEGKMIANFGIYAPVFHTHVVFARHDLIEHKPRLLKRFLTAFFETVEFMKTNRAATDDIAARVLGLSRTVAKRTYDEEIGMLMSNGRFDPEAVKVIKETLVALDILDKAPPNEVMFTTRFVQ